jgi:hypothetical protein
VPYIDRSISFFFYAGVRFMGVRSETLDARRYVAGGVALFNAGLFSTVDRYKISKALNCLEIPSNFWHLKAKRRVTEVEEHNNTAHRQPNFVEHEIEIQFYIAARVNYFHRLWCLPATDGGGFGK